MKRGKGKFRITRHATTTVTTPTINTATTTTATPITYDHDRKKNVLIDPNEMFLKYLKITTAEGRPKVLSLSQPSLPSSSSPSSSLLS